MLVRSIEELSWDGAVLLDVRSPAEYAQAHIPGAINLPLLSDQERVLVGTCYKREGRHPAVLLGLKLVGARLGELAEEGAAHARPGQPTIVYCWRGGERSASMGWLLEKVGLQVVQLRGGYKAFRRLVLNSFSHKLQLRVLGGYTGSGKTSILNHLAECGEQVIDLEGLANHRGSAFGQMGPQPRNEMFENLLAQQWLRQDPQRPTWIEDESRSIGSNFLPDRAYQALREAPLYFLDIPREARITYLLQDYLDRSSLGTHLERIRKRLGERRYAQCREALAREDWSEVARITLEYYDGAYLYGKSKRDSQSIQVLNQDLVNPVEAVRLLRA